MSDFVIRPDRFITSFDQGFTWLVNATQNGDYTAPQAVKLAVALAKVDGLLLTKDGFADALKVALITKFVADGATPEQAANQANLLMHARCMGSSVGH